MFDKTEIESLLLSLNRIAILLPEIFGHQINYIKTLVELIKEDKIEEFQIEINSYRMWGKSGLYESIGGGLSFDQSIQIEHALLEIAKIIVMYPNHYNGLNSHIHSIENYLNRAC
jgi:hypothetical protein